MADKVEIPIVLTSNTTGAQQAAAVIEKIDKSAQQAAPSVAAVGKGSQEMARGLGEGAAVGNAAVAAISNLQNVSQGGVSGLLAIARAGFATGIGLKGVVASLGPFGLIAAGAGIGLGVIATALRSSEEAAASAAKKFDEAKESGTALAKVEFANQVESLKLVNKELSDQITKSKEAAAAQAEIATEMDKTAKTEIDNLERIGKMSKERADLAKAGIDAGADSRAAKDRVSGIQAELDAYKAAAAKAQSISAPARSEAETALGEVDVAEAKRRALSTAEFAARAARQNLADAAPEDRFSKWKEKEAAERALEAAKLAAPDGSSDVNSPRMKELRQAAEKAMEKWAPAGESIEAMRDKVDELTQKLAARVGVEEKLAAEAKKQAKAEQMKPATTKEQAAASTSDARMKEEGAAGYMNRAAAGGAVDVEQFARVFPKLAAQMDAIVAKGKEAEAQAAKPPTTDGQRATRDPLAKGPEDSRIKLGDAPYAPDQVNSKNQITRGPLKPGSDNTANTGPNSLTPLVDSVKAAASPMDAASAALQEAASTVLPDFEPAATAAQTIAASLKEAADTELPDFTPAAEAAAALATTVSTFASTNAEFASNTTSALSATAIVVSDHDKSIGGLKDEMKTIKGQMAALRSKVK